MIAALVIVFGWVLPRFIDYDQVWAAISSLTLGSSSFCSGSGWHAFRPRR